MKQTSRIHRTFPVLLVIATVALFAACGGSGGGGDEGTPTPAASPTPEGTTFTSDDGMLSLFVPNGAMPEGTEISLTSVPHDQLPPELQELSGSGDGYLMEPDGLLFGEPATATLTLDRASTDDAADTETAYALVSYNETAGREVLDSETTYTQGESTAVVQAALSHFSWITDTRGSLRLRLTEVDEQPVLAPFPVAFEVANRNRDLIQIRMQFAALNINETLDFVCAGSPCGSPRISEVTYTDFSPIDAAIRASDEGYHKDESLVCKMPGRGQYEVRVTGESTPRTGDTVDPASVVMLTIRLRVTMNCLAGGTAQPPPSPAQATPVSSNQVRVASSGECEHTKPGVESESRDKVKVTDARTNAPVNGATVSGEAQGPALINDTASVVTDAQGEGKLVFRITAFGDYTMAVTKVTLANGTEAFVVSDSVTQVTQSVGQVCTPP